MKKIMLVFGTRPEAIKMCPLVLALKSSSSFSVTVCTTGQHKVMLDQVLQSFNITPDFDLSIMKPEQSLFDITVNILTKIQSVLSFVKPDLVLVHGDTSTAFSAALACYYLKIDVAHIEAGLRTNNIYSPYPEEFNRQSLQIISKYDFAPTQKAKENLIKDGKSPDNVFVTGNTIIDTLMSTLNPDFSHQLLSVTDGYKLIIVTAHRRENLGAPMNNICNAVAAISEKYSDVKVIFPAHTNPAVREKVTEFFRDFPSVHVVNPLEVYDFHNLLARSYLVLTDSGGIQEEAAFLHIPTLVLRNNTERSEELLSGSIKLVGTNENNIYTNACRLIEDVNEYEKMKSASCNYSGGACEKIVRILERIL